MRKLLVLVCLASLAFAGCGGGKDDTSTAATDAGSKAAGGTATTVDTDFSGKGSGDFCDLARKYEQEFDKSGSSQTPADVEKEYKDLASAIDKLVGEAPSEIKADASKVNGAFKDLNTLLAKYHYDFSKIPESEAQNAKLDDPEIQAASNRVESYFEKVCKIDSDGDGDTDGVIDDGSSSGEQAPGATTDDTTDGSGTTETTQG
jgi:hypothetical protein